MPLCIATMSTTTTTTRDARVWYSCSTAVVQDLYGMLYSVCVHTYVSVHSSTKLRRLHASIRPILQISGAACIRQTRCSDCTIRKCSYFAANTFAQLLCRALSTKLWLQLDFWEMRLGDLVYNHLQIEYKLGTVWATVPMTRRKSRTMELLAFDEYCRFDTSAFF